MSELVRVPLPAERGCHLEGESTFEAYHVEYMLRTVDVNGHHHEHCLPSSGGYLTVLSSNSLLARSSDSDYIFGMCGMRVPTYAVELVTTISHSSLRNTDLSTLLMLCIGGVRKSRCEFNKPPPTTK